MSGAFLGTGRLIRLILRQERILLPVWIVLTIVAPATGASAVISTYPTAADRQHRVDQIQGTPMFEMFQGRAFDSSIGALTAQQGQAMTVLVAAIGAALLVARHTRGEETAGRRELLGSTVVGRLAPLAGAQAVVFGSGVLIAAGGALILVALGLPASGSAAMGSLGLAAAMLAGSITAIAAQLTMRMGVAALAGAAALYVFHMLRGVAVVGDGTQWMVWLIPNGWLEEVRPYTENRWWWTLAVIVLAVILGAVAARLSATRDIGAALLRVRPGPAVAARGLRNDLALAIRLHRGGVIGFGVFVLLMGLVLGAGGSSVASEYARAQWIREYAEAMRLDDPADALYIYIIFTFVFVAGVHTVLTILRLHRDETSGIAAIFLAGPLRRTTWAARQLTVAVAGPALLQLALGVGLGIGSWSATGDVGELWRPLRWTMPLVVSLWVVVSVTFLAFGLRARLAPWVGWIVLSVGIVAELAVKAELIPEWIYFAISPFAMVTPYFQPTAWTFIALLAFAVAAIATGMVTLRHRDLASSA